MRAGQPIAPSAHIVIYAEPGTASMAFTATTPTDAHLRSPDGHDLYIYLDSDAWASDIGHYQHDMVTDTLVPTPATEALLGGIFGFPRSATGFGLVQDFIDGKYEYVRRINDSVVVIGIPAIPLYRLTAEETVRVRLLPMTLRSQYNSFTNAFVAADVVCVRAEAHVD